MNKIATIVVTYNRKELLLECIEALLAQTFKNMDVLVIDNASTDGTKEYIEHLIGDRVLYFNTGDNIGGAGGFNYGLKTAVSLGYEYFWMMDDDSIPAPDALSTVIKAHNKLKGRYGFLCSNVKWTDGSVCNMNIPDISKSWSSDSALLEDGLIKVDRATFVGFFTRLNVVKAIGYPIKEFFIWADDTNYSYRINKKFESYYVSQSIIVHKMKTNQSADIVNDVSGRNERYFYAFRNRYYNARKFHKLKGYYKELVKNTIKIIFKSKYKFSKLKYMYKGFFTGLFFNPKLEK